LPSFAPSTKFPSGSPIVGGGGGGSDCDDPSDPLSCYDFVGDGYCANELGLFHILSASFIQFQFITDADATLCAAKCNECVKEEVPEGSFRGFELDNFGAATACACFFDDSLAGFNGSCEYFAHNDGHTIGTNQIVAHIPSPGRTCYKIKAN